MLIRWSKFDIFIDTLLPYDKTINSKKLSFSLRPTFESIWRVSPLTMKNIVTILTVICAIAYAAEAQKLQIGVKKRVENCTQKAQKGDLVHIHYTVNIVNPEH